MWPRWRWPALAALVSVSVALGAIGALFVRGSDADRTGPARPAETEIASGTFFPVLAPASAIPAALTQGRIVSRGGCLWLQPAEGRELYLILWPPGSRFDQGTGRVTTRAESGAEVSLGVGDRMRAGGGETRDLEFVATLTGQRPPLACQTGESYWRAYVITPLP